ncbi:hypothetical protein J2D69_12975 [Lysinibacillus sphaericus]|uniref:Uncharacterized protein n=3 Tax=Lysinibacillus TaxID=400634 RepID=W7RSE3_LYSSH|nr:MULTISPECIES: hypothetical protein [Lysinibacillus]MBE5083613.1 hypothetical protein [Bacillus thuringiensis]AMO33369.1 hypothetical protein AR327_13430 [Lysinibacillus sphaericus]AMR91528.1 hypothetical protein A1T07_15790 [Lysinibacillus sphaericus]ANA45575.1 hypothetical protein A2J09_08450 [Lysinibacillus sphaericus]EWH33449.1 hypothetical protein P799_10990 [Lysinibacillus sphaericus CBAM5]
MKNCPNCLATNSYKKSHKEYKDIYVCEYCGAVSEDYAIIEKETHFEYNHPEIVRESANRTYYYREVTPPKWPKKIALILISIIGLLIVGQSIEMIFSEEEKPTKQISTITPEMFRKLKIGMSEETVKEIVGYGALHTDENKLNYKGKNGVEENSMVSLEFNNGKLEAIYEFGLITKRKY